MGACLICGRPTNEAHNKHCSRACYGRAQHAASVARFWNHVEKRDPSECWPWKKRLNSWGYGTFVYNKRRSHASRIAWILSNEEEIGDRLVRHACDNPACCNPAHLIAGTQRENMRDMSARCRSAKQRVTHCPSGHPYDEANTRWTLRRGGMASRYCRRCNANAQARRKARIQGEAA